MEEKREVAVVPEGAALEVFNPEDVVKQIDLIHRCMKLAMIEGEDYGVIPGCKKPSLQQPGAEKLDLMFRMRPEYTHTFRDLEGGHLEVISVCKLYSIKTGQLMGEATGSCSTMEKKYRWRDDVRVCPVCGVEGTIIKGKEEYGGGWLCFGKKGGCGAKFLIDDPAIADQKVGRVENPDISDLRNTVLKISDKRAHVSATKGATAASAVFTVDIDETLPPGIKPSAQPPKKETLQNAPPPVGNYPGSYKDTILQYKKRAAARGETEVKELNWVIDEYLTAHSTSMMDATEKDCQEILKAITAHYQSKAADKKGGK